MRVGGDAWIGYWLVAPKLAVAELFDAVDQPGNKAKRRQPIKRPDQASA